jgi:hypothetical protein
VGHVNLLASTVKVIQRILFTLSLVIFTASCGKDPSQTGTLMGHVMIGPLVPAVQRGFDPTPSPDVYAAREIVITRASNGGEVARLKINNHGNYRGTLPVGTYLVDINHLGIDSADGFPTPVEITAGSIVVIDVDIDTGIR